MAHDDNTRDSTAAANTQMTLFTMYASDGRMLKLQKELLIKLLIRPTSHFKRHICKSNHVYDVCSLASCVLYQPPDT